VDELVSEIAAASKEQSQGVDQVVTAVSQMEKVTQTTAASAEECAAAAQELNAQAIAQDSIVGQLRALSGATTDVYDRTSQEGYEAHSPAVASKSTRPRAAKELALK
jgi:methyl-accepting chemotaxis protein